MNEPLSLAVGCAVVCAAVYLFGLFSGLWVSSGSSARALPFGWPLCWGRIRGLEHGGWVVAFFAILIATYLAFSSAFGVSIFNLLAFLDERAGPDTQRLATHRGLLMGGIFAALCLWYMGADWAKTKYFYRGWELIFWFWPRRARFGAFASVVAAVFIYSALLALGSFAGLLLVLTNRDLYEGWSDLFTSPAQLALGALIALVSIATLLAAESLRREHGHSQVTTLDMIGTECEEFLRKQVEKAASRMHNNSREIAAARTSPAREVAVNVVAERLRVNSLAHGLERSGWSTFTMVDWLPTIGYFSAHDVGKQLMTRLHEYLFCSAALPQLGLRDDLKDIATATPGTCHIFKLICWPHAERAAFMLGAKHKFAKYNQSHSELLTAMLGVDDDGLGTVLETRGTLEADGYGAVWFSDHIGQQHFVCMPTKVLHHAVDPRDSYNAVRGQRSESWDLVDLYRAVYDDILADAVMPRSGRIDGNNFVLRCLWQSNIRGARVEVSLNLKENRFSRVVPGMPDAPRAYHLETASPHDIACTDDKTPRGIAFERLWKIRHSGNRPEWIEIDVPLREVVSALRCLRYSKEDCNDAWQEEGGGVFIRVSLFKALPMGYERVYEVAIQDVPCGNHFVAILNYSLEQARGRFVDPFIETTRSGPSNPLFLTTGTEKIAGCCGAYWDDGTLYEGFDVDRFGDLLVAPSQIAGNMARFIVDSMRPVGNVRVLSVGCGSGRVEEMLASEFLSNGRSIELHVVDLNQAALDKLRENFKQLGLGDLVVDEPTEITIRRGGVEARVFFHRARIEAAPSIFAGRYDAILALFVLHHVGRWYEVMNQLLNVLEDQGVFVISEQHGGIAAADGGGGSGTAVEAAFLEFHRLRKVNQCEWTRRPRASDTGALEFIFRMWEREGIGRLTGEMTSAEWECVFDRGIDDILDMLRPGASFVLAPLSAEMEEGQRVRIYNGMRAWCSQQGQALHGEQRISSANRLVCFIKGVE